MSESNEDVQPTVNALDPVEAARSAALSRLDHGNSTSLPPSSGQKALREFRLKLLAIIDHDFLKGFRRSQALAALDLLSVLLHNAINDPSKRSVRIASNKAFIKRVGDQTILDGPFTLYLHETGWRHQTIDFEARRTFPAEPRPEQLEKLKIGEEVLRTRLETIKRNHDAVEQAKQAEKDAENARTLLAKRHIESDREEVRARVEREQAARLRMQESQSSPPPPAQP